MEMGKSTKVPTIEKVWEEGSIRSETNKSVNRLGKVEGMLGYRNKRLFLVINAMDCGESECEE
jgi:hypothetical protein